LRSEERIRHFGEIKIAACRFSDDLKLLKVHVGTPFCYLLVYLMLRRLIDINK
jgi:hypothetical protein